MRQILRKIAVAISWFAFLETQATYANDPIHGANTVSTPENIARGRPYLLDPAPNYLHSKGDVHAQTRLTDGIYTDPGKSSFWTESTTVGWAASTVEITFDLGKHYGIKGVSLGTALSTGTDVVLPESIDILVSENGQDFHLIGDLVELDKRPRPIGSNKIFRFTTQQLQIHGRYVKLIVKKGGPFFIFTDEVEVFRGDDAWRFRNPLPGPPVRYSKTRFENRFSRLFKARLDSDLFAVRGRIERAVLPTTTRDSLQLKAGEIEKGINELPELAVGNDFFGIFPLNRLHADTYALLGRLQSLSGKPPIVIWSENELDHLDPMESPSLNQPLPKVKIAAMIGEKRAGIINLRNNTEHDRSISLKIARPKRLIYDEELILHQVSFTDTLSKIPIAAAITDIKKDSNGWRVNLPAGMTQQIWIQFKPSRSRAGVYKYTILVDGASESRSRIELELRVFNLKFPDKPTLKIGGFDYSDRPSSSTSYGVTHTTVDRFIEFLRAYNVRNTWASTWVMPHGSFKRDGSFQTQPDTSLFDSWIRRWPDAEGYYIYIFATYWGGRIGGTQPGDPLFQRKIGEWAKFWANHAKKRGVAGKIWLVPVDEPDERNPINSNIFISWSAAIKKAAPELQIWLDPNYAIPSEVPSAVWTLSDAISPLYRDIRSKGSTFRNFYGQMARSGKRLEMYVIATNSNDPYTEYRLPAWWAFRIGANTVSYWAFGDNGGGQWNSWNQYSAEYTSYSPAFLTASTVTTGKHMEAISFGLQDFEYLVILQNKINYLNKYYPKSHYLPRARRLLEYAVQQVTEPGHSIDHLWHTKKDRSVADAMRLEIAELLETMKH